MGREWLYKATGGSGDGRKSPSAGAGKTINSKKPKYKNTSSPGCMSAIYNLFDIQHHQLRFHHPSFMASDSTNHSSFRLQGIEAPRNSLESSESAVKVILTSSEAKEQTNLNITVGRIKIKTNRSSFSDDLSPETCISPGTKTPNLVARLMGLDILPEYSSPRPSSSSTKANSDHLSRSLPVTPRLSTASRKSTDNVFHHHRLSLQINKENYNICKERTSPKEVKKQTRERIGRRLGTDITNTVSGTRSKCQRRDLNLVKAPANETAEKAKVRVLDIKGNLSKPVLNSPSSAIEEVKSKPQTPVMKQKKVVKDENIKRMVSERYDLRLKKMNQQEKVFVSKKSTRKKLTSFKKEMTSSCLTTTKLSQKQASLRSNNSLNLSYTNSNDTHNLKANSYSFMNVSWRSMGWLSSEALKVEVEGMVVEIEREIMDNLVHDIATETVQV